MKTLLDLDLAKQNNFDAIRFLAASLVILSHAFAVGGQPGSEPLAGATGFITFGSLAVEIFFVVSGYLIVKSLVNKRSLFDFVEARILRIFPALIVCCVFSTLFIGLAVTRLSASDYLTDVQTWRYLAGNASLLQLQWFLPGVFDENSLKGVVNGSLWTLPIELRMYGVVLALGLLTVTLKRYRPALLTMCIGGYVLYQFATQAQVLADHVSAMADPLSMCFLMGALWYLLRKYVPVSATLALGLWAVTLLCKGSTASIALYYIALSYSIMVVAFDENFPLFNFGKHGDFSYGLYLYGFPVKQAMAAFAFGLTPYLLFLIAFPVTLLLAWLSWNTIEKPALRQKGTIARLSRSQHMGAIEHSTTATIVRLSSLSKQLP
jgi:peptidoglycan/LPS O-acetylase OafA/YrhL